MKVFGHLVLIAGLLGATAPAQDAPVAADQPVVEELSQEELDAEMERMEEALEQSGEVKEFIPQKPLAADLPVALPSDI